MQILIRFILSFSILYICCFSISHAQIQTEVPLSPKHQQKLEQVKDTKKYTLLLKKFSKKDSTKQAKKALKNKTKGKAEKEANTYINENKQLAKHKQQADQFNNLDSASLVRTGSTIGQKEINKRVDKNMPEIPDIDSRNMESMGKETKSKGIEAAEKTKFAQKNQEVVQVAREIPTDSTSLKNFGSTIKKSAKQQGESLLKENSKLGALEEMKAGSGFEEIQNQKTSIEQTQKEIQQAAAEKDLKKKMIAVAGQQIAKHAQKIEQIKPAMAAIDNYKQKYSHMPNSNDLSSAKKRSSLIGEPIWKRFFIGGNLNVQSTKPFVLDISPMIGFRVNKLFEIGGAATYRHSFKKDSAWNVSQDNVYGYSIFANHRVYRNFFGYLEGERMNTASMSNDLFTRTWKQTLLLGVGRNFRITKFLDMQAILTINLLHDNLDGVHSDRIVFKTGFRVRK